MPQKVKNPFFEKKMEIKNLDEKNWLSWKRGGG
jgi:hypothetical protein